MITQNPAQPQVAAHAPVPVLTPEQQQKLNMMLTHVQYNLGINNPRFLDPVLLNRFLIAKGYNIEKATKLFTEYWEYRQRERIDIIIADDYSKLALFRTFYPRSWYHTDAFGRPILIEQMGKVKFSEIFKHFTQDELKKLFYLHYEMIERVILPACSRVRGHPVTQFVSIIDTKGISMTDLMSKNVYTMMQTASKMAQDYYPELVAKSFIINTPMLFSGFFNVIKPLLNSRTQMSLSVMGSSYIKDMTLIIPLASLPAILGGTNPDPLDGQDHGFYVPEIERCMTLKKWDLTQEERAGMPGPAGGMMPPSHLIPTMTPSPAGLPVVTGSPAMPTFPGQLGTPTSPN